MELMTQETNNITFSNLNPDADCFYPKNLQPQTALASFEEFKQLMPEQQPIFKVVLAPKKNNFTNESSTVNALDLVMKEQLDDLMEYDNNSDIVDIEETLIDQKLVTKNSLSINKSRIECTSGGAGE